MVRRLIKKAGSFFTKGQLVTEADKKAAIEGYLKTERGLNLSVLGCLSYPGLSTTKKMQQWCEKFKSGSEVARLCRVSSSWLHNRLNQLQSSCTGEVAECLQQLRLPLMQTALVGLNSNRGGEDLYTLRHPDLPKVQASLLKSKHDAVTPLFSKVFGDSSSVSAYGRMRVDSIVRDKNVDNLPPKRRRRLWLTLLIYILLDMRSSPQLDPMLLGLLLRMTTSGCKKKEKRKLELSVSGKKIKVPAGDIMLVAWSELLKNMLSIGNCSSNSSDHNCVLLNKYIEWKQQVAEQLNMFSKAFAGGTPPVPQVVGHQDVQDPGGEAVQKLASQILGRVENALFFANSMMRMKFKWVLNFLGKHKSLRKLVIKLAKSVMSKLFGVRGISQQAHKKAEKLKLVPGVNHGLTLFYGVQKDAEVFILTSKANMARLMGQLVKRSLKDLWGIAGKIGSQEGLSLIQNQDAFHTGVSHCQKSKWRNNSSLPVDRQDYGASRRLLVKSKHERVFPSTPRGGQAGEVSLLQTRTMDPKFQQMLLGAGVGLFLFGLYGLLSGGISIVIPVIFIVAGILVSLVTVIVSLVEAGILPGATRGRAAGAVEPNSRRRRTAAPEDSENALEERTPAEWGDEG
ncbi:hypothetical protein BESB_061300 [Besnoitia besnoiti]|uniref:Transmembrane protein n=1 Tax=Besnoitia besnoiti TaxID=94643 RepID=A0A2A9MHX1_BESBE|nr:hypothetical protein BESB_061300 [Besnoitia besnoiti]PFH35243.1 hypothetical protein BESB_061300 [Besnoitia besnoiti]